MGTFMCVPRRGGGHLATYLGIPVTVLTLYEQQIVQNSRNYIPGVPVFVQDVAYHWDSRGADGDSAGADVAAVAPDSMWLAKAEQVINKFARKSRRLTTGKNARRAKRERSRRTHCVFEKPLAEISGKEKMRAVHCIALLTLFLRKLPEPLLPAVFVRRMEEIFLDSSIGDEAKAQALDKATREIFIAAYPSEYATFQYVKQLVQRHRSELIAVEVEALAQLMVREGDDCVVQFLVQQVRPLMSTAIIEPRRDSYQNGNQHTQQNNAQIKPIEGMSENLSPKKLKNNMENIENREVGVKDTGTQRSSISSEVSGAASGGESPAVALQRMRYVETSEFSTCDAGEEKPEETDEEKPEETDEEKPEETHEEKPEETDEEKPEEKCEDAEEDECGRTGALVAVHSCERLTASEMKDPVELTPHLSAVSRDDEKLTDMGTTATPPPNVPIACANNISVHNSMGAREPSPGLAPPQTEQHPRYAALLSAKQLFLGFDHLPPPTVTPRPTPSPARPLSPQPHTADAHADAVADASEEDLRRSTLEPIAAQLTELSVRFDALSRAADSRVVCCDSGAVEERVLARVAALQDTVQEISAAGSADVARLRERLAAVAEEGAGWRDGAVEAKLAALEAQRRCAELERALLQERREREGGAAELQAVVAAMERGERENGSLKVEVNALQRQAMRLREGIVRGTPMSQKKQFDSLLLSE